MSPKPEKFSSSNLRSFQSNLAPTRPKVRHETKKGNTRNYSETVVKIENLKEVKSTDARFKIEISSLISEGLLNHAQVNNYKLPKFSFDEILNSTSKFPKIISNSIHPEDSNPWGKVYETVMGNRNDWRNFEQLCNKNNHHLYIFIITKQLYLSFGFVIIHRYAFKNNI